MQKLTITCSSDSLHFWPCLLFSQCCISLAQLLTIYISYAFYICKTIRPSTRCPKERAALHMQGIAFTLARSKIVPTTINLNHIQCQCADDLSSLVWKNLHHPFSDRYLPRRPCVDPGFSPVAFECATIFFITYESSVSMASFQDYHFLFLKGRTTPETTKFDRNLNTYLSCHNFFPLSSVQILFIPACCLLCVL